MIGGISDIVVETPPQDLLGKFTTPGAPEKVLEWLGSKDLSQYESVIVSTDMLAFGGLIASREMRTSAQNALNNLKRFAEIRNQYPSVKFYGFSAIMRLSPTSTRRSAAYRDILVKAVLGRERALQEPTFDRLAHYCVNALRLPEGALGQYYAARQRNHQVQQELIRQVKNGVLDYLIVGQDDAQPNGPQASEAEVLKELAGTLGVRGRTYFCEGIDQHSNVLVSRALLESQKWSPKVRVVYADPEAEKMIPPYETSPIGSSLVEQVVASGAVLAKPFESYDYALYVNTPIPRRSKFEEFIQNLDLEMSQSFPVAVADINLGKAGTGDPELFSALNQNGRAMRLLSYAGWNTAGNTLGTAIPAANVYLCARKLYDVDPLERELNQRSFLLHRLVNDFEYHRNVRPQAYRILDSKNASRDEAYGEPLKEANEFVQQDLARRLESIFHEQFAGQRFFAGTRQYEFEQLRNVNVSLPWPRAYEVKIGFDIAVREVR